MLRTFLVGCARSGTTFLQSMLATHSKITSFPETHLFAYTIPTNTIFRIFKIYAKRDKVKIEKYLIKNQYNVNCLKQASTIFFSTNTWVKFVFSVLDSIPAEEVLVWIEKTPSHLYYLDILQKADPDCKFIHLIRPGKDVIASLHRASDAHPDYWGGKRTIEQCVVRWKRDIETSARYIGRPNHIFINYTNLSAFPQEILSSICSFLNIRYEDQMHSEYYKTASHLVQKEELPWKIYNVQQQKSTKIFEEYFDPQEQDFIQVNIKDMDLSIFPDVI